MLNLHLIYSKNALQKLNVQERKVIQAYRTKKELQQAVNILLGLEDQA